MPYGLESIDQIKQARELKRRIKQLIQHELEDGMDPWWFISFHYNDGKTNEDQVVRDRVISRISSNERFIGEETEGLKEKAHSLIPGCWR